ncbi:glycosyltransferase family 2 protein [Halorubellus litoreus]|uniref:Glycosyltransferase family 2 protein n=1 Tax=Halorubellus litoreus TaxID=755308 RepID=A0ABD5VIL8_9EURY
MYDGCTVAVVVPAYDEGDTVADVLASMPSYVDRVYAIDDDSTDDTWAEICRVAAGTDETMRPTNEDNASESTATDGTTATGASDDDRTWASAADDDREERSQAVESIADGGTAPPDVVPIRHEENQGAGGALKTGYRRAMDDGMDVTVTMDADGQMDPADMADLVEPVAAGRAGYAKGNRLAKAEYREEMPTFRFVGNWLLSILTKIASGHWNVMDSQNGYTAISGDALAAIDLTAVGDDHQYTNDVLVQLNVEGVRVEDVPMPAEYGDENSTISLTGFVPQTSFALLEGFCYRLKERHVARDFHPLSMFYGLGVLTVLTGVVTKLHGDDDDGSLLVAIQGVAFLLFGMVLDRRENEHGGDDA